MKASESLTNSGNSDIISGATYGAYNNTNDPEGKKRDAHAERYYSALRNSNKDDVVNAIARNSAVDAESVSKMYDHLLVNKYNINGELKNFHPDYDIAESTQRLREGKNIQKHDRLLIGHESLEYDLMNRDELSYQEAHEIANKSYNYQSALYEWLDQQKKG